MEKSTRELVEEYEKWKRRHEALLEEYGLVARTLMPGQRLETPKRPLTPEAIEAIDEAKHKMDEAWDAYWASLR